MLIGSDFALVLTIGIFAAIFLISIGITKMITKCHDCGKKGHYCCNIDCDGIF